ncbi:MAG TPA: MlaD family protein [Syntrophobacteraceae bacterium]|nr:MlaD family protein [Syntrophobacteraceae bacterium]
MSKKASPTAIGAFIVGTIVLVLLGIVLFGSGKFFKKTLKFVLFFEGSVKGLSVGSPVDFKGVKVGSVSRINVLMDRKDRTVKIAVYIDIDPARITEMTGTKTVREIVGEPGDKTAVEVLIEQGLRAQLDIQSLVTGQLYVLLDFLPDKPARMVGAEDGVVEIPTVPSTLETISKTIDKLPIEELSSKIVAAINGLEQFINSPELKDTMVAVKETAHNARSLVETVNGEIKPLSAGVKETLADARKLLKGVDTQIQPLLSKANEVVKDTQGFVVEAKKGISPLVDNAVETLKLTQEAVRRADRTLASLEDLTGERSSVRFELTDALKEISSAARSLRTLADYLERHPEALLTGKSRHGER